MFSEHTSVCFQLLDDAKVQFSIFSASTDTSSKVNVAGHNWSSFNCSQRREAFGAGLQGEVTTTSTISRLFFTALSAHVQKYIGPSMMSLSYVFKSVLFLMTGRPALEHKRSETIQISVLQKRSMELNTLLCPYILGNVRFGRCLVIGGVSRDVTSWFAYAEEWARQVC